MAYVESEKTFSPEKIKKLEAAIALLEDAVERHEQTLPDAISTKELKDLSEAAALYEECKGDYQCGREHLRFALDDFTRQIKEKQQAVNEYTRKVTAAPEQPRSKRLEGSSDAFKERYSQDPLKDLAEMNKKYAGKPEMISDEEDKIACYQAAKLLLKEVKNPVNPIKPAAKDKPTVAFAKLAVFELQGEVEALLAGRMAEAA